MTGMTTASIARPRSNDAVAQWPVTVPLVALAVFGLTLIAQPSGLTLMIFGLALMGAVVSAVHHAEVIAHRVGEPFGTLILAVAVTVIEAALILSVMLAGGDGSAALARDALFAAVMIICNGVVGLCLLVGGLRHVEQSFRVEGTGSGLAALAVLSTLVLVEPALTVSAPANEYTTGQLWFVALSSLILWLVFIFIQTVRHRDYFLPRESPQIEATHATPPSVRAAWQSFALLLPSLIAVVGLAKALSPSIEQAIIARNAPIAIVGVLIAMIVLLPEAGAALRAAHADRLQASLNLAIGSAMACIGLTVPVVVGAAVALDLPLMLGLDPTQIALLALTFVVGAITLGSGRTNMMQGAIHLVIFAAFLFLTLVP
jgi:Ca2+:H+ antiporter